MHRLLLWTASAMLTAVLAAAEPKAALVVVEKVSGHLGFYDADGKCLKEVKVGAHPHEMAFSPDGRYAYVTNNGMLLMTMKGEGENTVSIVDLKEEKNTGTIDLGKYRRPHGIDVDAKTGNVLVTTELPSALLVIEPRTRTIVKEYDVHGKAPHMVRIAPDGRIAYVSNTDTSTLAAVDLQTGNVKLIPTGPRPQGATFSPDFKRLYVANSGGESITVIDTAKQERIGEVPTGKGPVRIAVSPDGNTLIYAVQLGHSVGFADAKSLKEEKQIPLPGEPVSMTLSADGQHAFCSVQNLDKVYVISIPGRKIVRVFDTPKQSGPDPVLPIR